ncbi:alginate export family protein [Magnetospirillum aberrantis]|uniref:Alginate export family protein n=1 Tax=Magnetospirillum aberrantis SpK TaxID=908842 RepID=A0A7C9UVJ4_9PROT|nr:alginate export family protein [Magnetospirillum aberrantis]NFV79472.1 alginate export family protein [Magnetospirillum aberrantis SpK]
MPFKTATVNRLIFSMFVFTASCGTSAAWAEDAPDTGAAPQSGIPLYDKDGVRLQFDFTGGAGVFAVNNARLGAGVTSLKDGSREGNPRWFEAYIKPGLSGDVNTTSMGTFYGNVAVVGTTTQGEGDAVSATGTQLTHGGTSHGDLERLALGWKTGDLLPQKDAVDLSAGRQDFVLGDGFLLADGNADVGKEGTYWFGARSAWANSAIARFQWDVVHADAFWLKSDRNTGNMSIQGVNLEARKNGIGTIGAAFLRVADDDVSYSGLVGSDGVSSLRKGMKVYDFRAQGTPVPQAPDLFLSGEYVLQKNNAAGRKLDTDAWYGEVGYTFSVLPWKPTLSYRYAHFSGDDSGTADRSEAFDPLRYGMLRGWGSYFHGEVAGQYLLFNSNENLHMVHATVNPADTVQLGAIYYDFSLDQSSNGASKDFGQEIDLHADWAATPWLTVSGVYGRLMPGTSAKTTYGNDAMEVFELVTMVKF